jgi:hypothetical protein
MKSVLSILTVLFVTSSAFANDFAAVVGFRNNSADSTTTATVNTKSSLGLGVLGFFDLGGSLQGRVGFIYNQRNVSAGTPEYDYNLNYIDVPLTAMFKVTDYAGAFIGPVVGLYAGKECKVPGGCDTNPEGLLTGLQLGVSFKFAPQLGAELYYETVPSTYWKDAFKNMRTVGANLLFTFE